jgi:hypothetical protein
MGGTRGGACGPGVLAAKAACATTMRAGTISLRASFFMWISAESGNIFYVKKYVLHWFLRKYTLRCISPDAEITAENPHTKPRDSLWSGMGDLLHQEALDDLV